MQQSEKEYLEKMLRQLYGLGFLESRDAAKVLTILIELALEADKNAAD